MTSIQFRTWPYVPDIITPAGQLQAVDTGKDAVKITVDPTVTTITPGTVVTISPEALALLERAIS